MSRSVYIVANGARTPLGFEVASSAAAVRGALSAIGEHPFLIDQVGDPMPGAVDAGLDPEVTGSERLLALARPAMIEACAPLTAAGMRCPALPIYLALPEYRPGFTDRDAEEVRVGLASNSGISIEISEVSVAPMGHAAGLAVIAKAMELIENGLRCMPRRRNRELL